MALSGRLLAVGRTAEIYEWDGGVLKLHFAAFEANARLEAEIMTAISTSGVAAPRLLDSVTVAGRAGLVYERAEGPSMLAALLARPWAMRSLARNFAQLHAAQHDTPADHLPSLRDELRHTIEAADIAEAVKIRALERLQRLPDGNSLCHGDMHPGNVILTGAGPLVIDWVTARRGPAAADVARTHYLIRHAAAVGLTPARAAVVSVVRRRFTTAYLARYCQLRAIPEAQLAAWRLPILAARMAENVDADARSLHALVRRDLD